MNLEEYTIPKTDREAWDRYPSVHWVYNTPQLLSAQNIHWSPFKTKEFALGVACFDLESQKVKFCHTEQDNYIYVNSVHGARSVTDVVVQKGEIKWIGHVVGKNVVSEDIIGEVDLRINAFVTLYFKKFSGIVNFETYGNEIFAVRLRPYEDGMVYPSNAEKVIKKIYKKETTTV